MPVVHVHTYRDNVHIYHVYTYKKNARWRILKFIYLRIVVCIWRIRIILERCAYRIVISYKMGMYSRTTSPTSQKMIVLCLLRSVVYVIIITGVLPLLTSMCLHCMCSILQTDPINLQRVSRVNRGRTVHYIFVYTEYVLRTAKGLPAFYISVGIRID